MERTANKAQQAAIDARNSLVTVSAGAGTGKTWTLASRYASLLVDRERGCNAENIITLTFTEKAAQEMKQRIEAVVADRMKSAAESERIVLNNALAHFDDAYIQTIHSFASRVLRESAIALGLDPASSIISQPEEDELSEELVRKIDELDETIVTHFSNTGLLEKILTEWAPRDIAALSGECEEIHSARSLSYQDFMQMSDVRVLENVIGKVKLNSMPKIMSAWEGWQAVLHEIKDDIYYESQKKGKTPDYIMNLNTFIGNWFEKKIESDDEAIKFFVDLMESVLKRANFGKLKERINLCLGEPVTEWKERHLDLLTISKNLSVNEIMANYSDDVHEREALIKLCSICWKITEDKRRENKILTFSDLIKYGSESISSKNFMRNFREIMIDEFQDTDPLQERMIRSIARNQPNTSVFVVGDPKQSIYRFRNADLSIFESYVKECRQVNGVDGVYINMNESFRMRSGLYSKINELFRFIWPRNLGESISNLKYEDLVGDVDETRDAGTLPLMAMVVNAQCSMHNDQLKDDKDNAQCLIFNDQIKDKDAGLLPAALCSRLKAARKDDRQDAAAYGMTSGSSKLIARDAEGCVPYGQDVGNSMSLARGADHAGDVGKEGINEARKRLLVKLTDTLLCWKAEELTVWDSEEKCLRPFEWRDCAVLTQTRTSWTLIEEAFSKAGIPLIIEGNESWFVRGEVMDIINMMRAVAFPDDELSNIGWHSSFLSPRDASEEEFLRATAKVKGGAALLNYYIDNLSWLENIPASQSLRALANMRYAEQLALEYEKLICRSVHGCSEWLLKSLTSKSRFKEPQIADDGKSVKLLTVHASKGLEFPFVIIFGTERPSKGKRTNSSLAASKHLGLFASKHKLFKTFHYALEEQEEAEEYERLFYVAATRAKDSILFCGITDESGNAEDGSWLKYLIEWENSGEWRVASRKDSWIAKVRKTECRGGQDDRERPSPQKDAARKDNWIAAPQKDAARKDVEKDEDARDGEGCISFELPVSEVSLTRMSATSYALFEWCPHAWRRKHRQGMDLDFENLEAGAGSLSGKDIGSICHWVLSKWDFSDESLDNYLPGDGRVENVVRLLPPALRSSYRIKSNREKIKQWLMKFANSEIGEEFHALFSEGKLKREVPFRVSVANGIKLTGSFDVLWEDADGVHLRDWKTNPNDKVLELYKNQLIFYSFALHRLKQNISTLGLVSIQDCKLINIANSESFDIIEGRIIQAVKMAAVGPWDRKTENCTLCPW